MAIGASQRTTLVIRHNESYCADGNYPVILRTEAGTVNPRLETVAKISEAVQRAGGSVIDSRSLSNVVFFINFDIEPPTVAVRVSKMVSADTSPETLQTAVLTCFKCQGQKWGTTLTCQSKLVIYVRMSKEEVLLHVGRGCLLRGDLEADTPFGLIDPSQRGTYAVTLVGASVVRELEREGSIKKQQSGLFGAA